MPTRLRWLITHIGMRAFGLITLLSLGILSVDAQAQTYTEHTVYSFTATSSDGMGHNLDGIGPDGSLLALNGLLYGTASAGGTTGEGTIFSINPSTHTETTLCTFGTATIDGTHPIDGLIDVGGLLYGSTEAQGIGGFGTHNQGTVFSFDPSSLTETKLCTFTGDGMNGDAAGPETSLINVNGTLFGTTAGGGASGDGTVFSLGTNGSNERIVYSFGDRLPSSDGSYPRSPLILVNGILYGTTAEGGNGTNTGRGYGTIFSLDPSSGAEQILYRFTGTDSNEANSDGATPNAGLLNIGGILYGTTYVGGTNGDGVIFAFNPSNGTVKTLYSFTKSNGNSVIPQGSLINVNGILYGTTYQGGANNAGMVYCINPNGTGFHAIYHFGSTATDGAMPVASLINVNGTLYGTTSAGGANNTGTVFSLTPTPPLAASDSYTVKYNTALSVAAPGVLGNDTSGGNTPFTATLATNVTHGTLSLKSDGSFSYTPSAGYLGKDTFTYQAVSPGGKSNTATVTLTVQATAPIAVNNSNNVKYETTLSVPSPGVLGNDSNGGSAPMTAVLVTNVTHGTLTLSSSGAFSYTPAMGFAGTDSFAYQAVNAVGKSNIATATLVVQATTPTAHDDHGHGYYNTALVISAPGVLGNDDNGGKSPITATLVTHVAHGTLALNSDGSFKYTPATGFVGTDSFTYQAANSIGKGTMATCTLTISPVAPTAVNNSNNVKKNTTLSVPAPGVLGNDNTGGSPITAALVTNVTHGKLTLNSNGAFTYTPNSGFTGTDNFTYQAVNSVGTSNIATATLIVQ